MCINNAETKEDIGGRKVGRPKGTGSSYRIGAKEVMDRVVVDEATGCWNYRLRRNHAGYGRYKYRGRYEMAHRVAYMVLRGPIPAGMFLLHRCDNRACCNPDHLFFGTQADNMADKMAKGRQAKGEALRINKLTVPQVRAIYKAALSKEMSYAELALLYGVTSVTTIWNIANGKSWSHVTGHVRLGEPVRRRKTVLLALREGT